MVSDVTETVCIYEKAFFHITYVSSAAIQLREER